MGLVTPFTTMFSLGPTLNELEVVSINQIMPSGEEDSSLWVRKSGETNANHFHISIVEKPARWFKVPILALSWRSLNHPKKVTLNHLVVVLQPYWAARLFLSRFAPKGPCGNLNGWQSLEQYTSLGIHGTIRFWTMKINMGSKWKMLLLRHKKDKKRKKRLPGNSVWPFWDGFFCPLKS